MRLPFTDLHRTCRRSQQQLVHASLTANVDAFQRGRGDVVQKAVDWLEQRAQAHRLDAQHPKATRVEMHVAIAAELRQAAIDLAHLCREQP